MKNIAHRGFSGLYPENTMLAFEMACRTPGCDGIELDVHLTKDGELVIIHDETIDRTCVNGTGCVKDYTYEELKQFDVSYKFFGECEKQHIPTLREYFELVKDYDIVTNIELKTGVFEYPGIEQKVWELIREFDAKDRVLISSFNHFSVKRMKELCPDIKCGLLTESWLVHPAAYTKAVGAECYHPFFLSIDEEIMDEMKNLEIEVNVWTVNEEEDFRRMRELGVDAVITNWPDRVETSLGDVL